MGPAIHVHNITYGIGGALMAGDGSLALKLGRPLVVMAATRTDEPVYRQIVASEGYFALARFADPTEVLAVPEPKLPILNGSWHYMRGEAMAKLARPSDVRVEAAAIRPLSGTPSAEDFTLQASMLFDLERLVLLGRAAMLDDKKLEALNAFERAAAIQEEAGFSYITDPPAFWYSIQRSVAEVRLALGDEAGARAALIRSLKLRPKDPVALALMTRLQKPLARRTGLTVGHEPGGR